MRKEKLLSRWRREAARAVRRALAAQHAGLDCPLSHRTALKVTALLIGLALTSRAALAATIIVNTGTDESSPGDGFCSLREAINNANSPGKDTTGGDCNVGSGNDTIAIFVLSGQISVSIGQSNPLPTIQNTLTIVGPGQTVPVVGDQLVTLFSIGTSATVVLNSLAIEQFTPAVHNAGTLTITNCSFLNNSSGTSGGAIANEGGSLYVNNSTFGGNLSLRNGGAIANDSGVVSVSNSTFVNNATTTNFITCQDFPGLGGGIYNGQNQLFVISSSTFSGNKSCNGSSVANNTGGVLQVSGTILAGGGPGDECIPIHGQIDDLGYNICDDFTCFLTNSSATPGANGQKLGDGINPKLDASGLQNNGGPTDTIALQPGSPAIDAIPVAQCPATDQRGFSRILERTGPARAISALSN